MKVSECLTRDVRMAGQNETLQQAARLMACLLYTSPSPRDS